MENLYKKIFNRELTGQNFNTRYQAFPPLKDGYIPDPIKWKRLNIMQKQQHITRSNNMIDQMTSEEYREFYSLLDSNVGKEIRGFKTRPELYAGLTLPPGFDSVQDLLGAYSRDKFGDNFEHDTRRQ